MALFSESELETYLSDSTITTAAYTLAHAQAVAYLEAETGVRLTSQSDTITYTPHWDDAWIDLPVPTTDVASVSVDGTTLAATDYKKVDNRLYRRVGWGGSRWGSERRFDYHAADEYVSVTVSLTYGFADGSAPGELKTWGLILASQIISLADKVGVQSERIDDYSVTFATGAEQSQGVVGLPASVLGTLRSRYGRGTTVVAAR